MGIDIHTTRQPSRPATPAHREPQGFCDARFPGFIRHAMQVPYALHRPDWRRRDSLRYDRVATKDPLGVLVCHPEPLKAGTVRELRILNRNVEHVFLCRAVLVQETVDGWLLGLQLPCPLDQRRIRIVEQYCHMEVYLRETRYRDGPFSSCERLAKEWIQQFASHFPGG